MDLETISNRILDDNFGLDQSEEPPSEEVSHGEAELVEEILEDETDNYLEHYGVLGMKWGVRKDRVTKVKRRDRRYEGESDQDYQNRMKRESDERIAKTNAVAKLKADRQAAKERKESQIRQLKSQERLRKMEIKSQKEQKQEQVKADLKRLSEQKKIEAAARKEQEKERARAERAARKEKTNSKPIKARNLTDRELNDAIQRLRNEQTYKQLALENKPFFKRNALKAMAIGGGILLTVGTAVATQQLKKVGNEKAEDWLRKKKLLKPEPEKEKGGVSKSDIQNIVLETIKEMMENSQ